MKYYNGTYPARGTIAWMILNLIKFSHNRGAQKHEIMSLIFAVMGRGHYDITDDRGKFSSYFTLSGGQYGVVPRFCKKVGRRWVYNS